MRFGAIIADMDGVLTRTAHLHALAWQQMFREYLGRRAERDGKPIEPFDLDVDYRRYVDGKPRYRGVESFLESRELALPWGDEQDSPEAETVCGLGNRKNAIFHELLQQRGVSVYPEAVDRLGTWRDAGLRLAVVTSSRNGRRILTAAELLDAFDAVIDGNDLRRLGLPGKPEPDLFLKAAEALQVEPSEAVVLEDSQAGIEAAKRGQFGLVVGVAREGDRAEPLREAGADVVVSRLDSLTPPFTEIALRRPESFDRTTDPENGAAANWPMPEAARRRLVRQLEGKKVALFADYDGTLTPIVDRPEQAHLSESMRHALREAAERVQVVAVISGRDLADVRERVALEGLVYAGSHGYDVSGPDGLRFEHEQAEACLPDLDRAEESLRGQLDSVAGCQVERKRFAIAIHYRRAGEEDLPRIEAAVDEVQQEFPRLRKRGGKKIFELQPDVPWDKGRAVDWLLDRLELNEPDVLPIYLGDDLTDEDAFAALSERGVGICVGCGDRETDASYRLPDPSAVEAFLRSLHARLDPSEAADG